MMCDWGEEEKLWVTVPADLSHTGKERLKYIGVDKCIAPIVRALNEGGIKTTQSCCGHGKGPGTIDLADGRRLVIETGEGYTYPEFVEKFFQAAAVGEWRMVDLDADEGTLA